MKRLPVLLLLSISILTIPNLAFGMGTGNQFLDAQTGLTYVVYQPQDHLGLPQQNFQLLPCKTPGDDWILITYSDGKKTLKVSESDAALNCYLPPVVKTVSKFTSNDFQISVGVKCNPASAKVYQSCSTGGAIKYGGVLTVAAPSLSPFKATTIQIQGSAGISYDDLLNLANSLIPSDNIIPPTQKVNYAWDCGHKSKQPTSLTIYCADDGISLSNLKWNSWGASTSNGVGIYNVNLCQPSCANGKYQKVKVNVQLFAPEISHGYWVYTKIKIVSLKGSLPLQKKPTDSWSLVKGGM